MKDMRKMQPGWRGFVILLCFSVCMHACMHAAGARTEWFSATTGHILVPRGVAGGYV
jgi:fatty acid desaturase